MALAISEENSQTPKIFTADAKLFCCEVLCVRGHGEDHCRRLLAKRAATPVKQSYRHGV